MTDKIIKRSLEDLIMPNLFKGKVIIILGPRQAGKTTLARRLSDASGIEALWLSGDEADVREMLSNTTSARLKAIAGRHKLIIIDEAQRIRDIGLTLKLFADMLSDVQVIATGSSSFELANSINEPLTGRKYEYHLYPFSFGEMAAYSGQLDETRLTEHRMIYGYYPEVVIKQGEEQTLLRLISESYLFKDIFSLGSMKKPALLEKILQALALQIGNEVSYHEIGQLVGADRETVERYIDMLEKAFVVFRLMSLSRNLRNELKRGRKIYFWDNGIRNAVIKNFNQLGLRSDRGALWENFLVSERRKANHFSNRWVNSWFWRTTAQQEIDYIEEAGGQFIAWEFKWQLSKKKSFPKAFLEAYPESLTGFVDRENYASFLLD